jgi:hypothetical protein
VFFKQNEAPKIQNVMGFKWFQYLTFIWWLWISFVQIANWVTNHIFPIYICIDHMFAG